MSVTLAKSSKSHLSAKNQLAQRESGSESLSSDVDITSKSCCSNRRTSSKPIQSDKDTVECQSYSEKENFLSDKVTDACESLCEKKTAPKMTSAVRRKQLLDSCLKDDTCDFVTFVQHSKVEFFSSYLCFENFLSLICFFLFRNRENVPWSTAFKDSKLQISP